MLCFVKSKIGNIFYINTAADFNECNHNHKILSESLLMQTYASISYCSYCLPCATLKFDVMETKGLKEPIQKSRSHTLFMPSLPIYMQVY